MQQIDFLSIFTDPLRQPFISSLLPPSHRWSHLSGFHFHHPCSPLFPRPLPHPPIYPTNILLVAHQLLRIQDVNEGFRGKKGKCLVIKETHRLQGLLSGPWSMWTNLAAIENRRSDSRDLNQFMAVKRLTMHPGRVKRRGCSYQILFVNPRVLLLKVKDFQTDSNSVLL